MTTTDTRETIAKDASHLRVAMSHVPADPEYLPVLQYRVEQEIAAAERRLHNLRRLRVRTIEARQADVLAEATEAIGCTCAALGATGPGQRHTLCPAHGEGGRS